MLLMPNLIGILNACAQCSADLVIRLLRATGGAARILAAISNGLQEPSERMGPVSMLMRMYASRRRAVELKESGPWGESGSMEDSGLRS